MAHAKLSPSASSRWMSCSGSVWLQTLAPPEGASSYAAKGTTIHTLAEKALMVGKPAAAWLGQTIDAFTIDNEMCAIAQTYIDLVNNAVGTKVYEDKVTLDEVIPDCYGTADCLVMRPGHLSVIDLKTGAGVPVFAEENTQLLTYALGAYLKYDWAYDFQEVSMVISQPPLDNLSVWTVSLDRLMQHKADLIAAYGRIESEPETYAPSTKACQWCKAKSICPELKKMADAAATVEFADLKQDELSDWLSKAPLIRAFLTAVEDAAKTRLLSGKPVTGYKVVAGRSTRSWADPDTTKLFLKQQGYDESQICTKPELLSVAQMEKALKNEALDLTSYVEVKTGAPTIVPDSDKRKSVTTLFTAQKDFGA